MKKVISWLTALLLFIPLWAQAFSAVMWQPQLRDRQITPTQWQQLMQQLPKQGVDTLVLQWSRYGDALSAPVDQQWLLARAQDARRAGLKLVIGLYADPEFFTRQHQPDSAVTQYFDRLRREDRQQAAQWVKVLGSEAIGGWYLSAEIDDLRWRTPAAQQLLVSWLTKSHQDLAQIADKPIAVSSFFAGNMAPQQYRDMLNLLAGSGVKLWVQDGRGVGKLSTAQSQLYLDAITACPHPAVSAVIYERFISQADGHSFAPMTGPAPAKVLGCSNDSVLFELRYLPEARGIMEY
ncbi:DUF4434 domain-containing protein [Rouxiella sp. Mn2063]|uniref:DUF4434 domain-containing protein n=1 Tax=Rouxiella sp. Mn2063 TaxID=3395262 RepID=UPI003BE914E6